MATGLRGQSLPFGLEIDENDTITVVISSASLSNVTYNEDRTAGTGFQASATGSLQGTHAPEPSTLVLTACG